jgi:glycosyltransferase involved in cell wall biosynthesis
LNTNRKVIVISPVKNESWIIEEFITAASEFADHIILGDHGSTDNTVELASKHDKVRIIKSHQSGFEEAARRNELITEARSIGAGNVILAIDADELIDPRFLTAGGIDELRNLPIGTRIFFPHFNITPDGKSYWKSPVGATGFIDDGSLHPESQRIHFPRIPNPPKKVGPSRNYRHAFGGLIHLQYLNWDRVLAKTRWYKAWESVNHPGKSTLQIHRRYSHIDRVQTRKALSNPKEWGLFFSYLGIPNAIERSRVNPKTWWDQELQFLLPQMSQPTRFNLGLDEHGVSARGAGLLEARYESQLSDYLLSTKFLEERSDGLSARLALRLLDFLFEVTRGDK